MPMAIPIITVAIAAASAAYGVYSTQQQQKAQNNALEYQAKIGQRNAQAAEIAASNAEAQGEIDAKQHMLKVSGLIGSQRASGAASGALVDAGSNLDLQKDTNSYGTLDALTIRRNAGVTAAGYRNQGQNFQAESALAQGSKGSVGAAVAGSALTGASSLLSSANQFAKTYKSTKTPATV